MGGDHEPTAASLREDPVLGRGDNPVNFVSATDVAALAERAVTDCGLRGQVLELGGPDRAGKPLSTRLDAGVPLRDVHQVGPAPPWTGTPRTLSRPTSPEPPGKAQLGWSVIRLARPRPGGWPQVSAVAGKYSLGGSPCVTVRGRSLRCRTVTAPLAMPRLSCACQSVREPENDHVVRQPGGERVRPRLGRRRYAGCTIGHARTRSATAPPCQRRAGGRQ